MKIFILEDDEQLNQNLKLLFKRQGFAVDTFLTFKDAWHQIS